MYPWCMEYIAEKDLWCVETKLPMTIHGFVCRKSGVLYMFINSELSPEAKEEAIEHELDHIEHGDLFSEENAFDIENSKLQASKICK